MKSSRDIRALLDIMAALRKPQTGCAWDLEQTFATIAPYTIEEAFEVADAIARDNLVDLKDELGDLLLQVVFHAQMAQELGVFDFGDVVAAITEKLIRRHPHVFGAARDLSPEEIAALWAKIKAEEKRAKGDGGGALAAVKAGRPALARAFELQAAAGAVGFDWNDPLAVLEKIEEEAGEVAAALAENDPLHLQEEIGDLLFAVVNLARHAKIDPETALRGANAKFERRFGHIEKMLAAQGRKPAQATLAEMDALWDDAKAGER